MSSCAPAETAAAQLGRLRNVHALAQLGDGAFYVTSAAYLLRLGWSPTMAGLMLTLCWGIAALVSRGIGRLADRHGLVIVSGAAIGGCAVGLFGLALASPPIVLGCAYAVYAVGQSVWGGLRATLVQALATPATAVAERARLQAVGNGAVAVGAVFGGAALAIGDTSALRIVIAIDATLYLGAAQLVRRGLGQRTSGSPAAPTAPSVASRTTWRQLAVTTGAAALYLYMPLLGVAVPLMITRAHGIAAWTISACFLANTAGVVAFQRRAAAMASTAAGSRRALVIGGTLLAASCALLWTATHAPHASPLMVAVGLGAGVATQIAGEVCFAAGAWDLGYRLAPASGAAAWQTTYAAAIPVARSVGPALLAPLAIMPAGWLAPASLFLLGSATMVAATASSRPAVVVAGHRPHRATAAEPPGLATNPTESAEFR